MPENRIPPSSPFTHRYEGEAASGAPVDRARLEEARQIQAQINDDAEQTRLRFIHNVELAAAKNEKSGNPIASNAFPAIVKVYNEEFPRVRKDIEKAYMDAPDRAWLAANVDGVRRDAFTRMTKRINEIPGGMDAWKAAGQEAQGEGFFTPAIKKVYDTDRGGPQWGGIVGLLLGGYLLHTVTAAFGPLISTIATIAGAAFLAFIGNKLIDKQAEPLVTPDFHSHNTARSNSPQVAQHKSFEEIMANNSATITPTHGETGQPIDTNNLSPKQTPAIQKQKSVNPKPGISPGA